MKLPRTDIADPLPELTNPVQSTKTYGHEVGFSCAFRQWKAHSHCRFLHGYALGFRFVFSATEMDGCGWVVNFGGLKALKGLLEECFDHKTLVASDDPSYAEFQVLHNAGVIQMSVVPATGCEAFSRMVFDVAQCWLKDAGFSPRVTLQSVEVSEHGANSAICFG
jgi:6-pyruvoyltetrahydropterin/6-carboxytetrahydropterin synthase